MKLNVTLKHDDKGTINTEVEVSHETSLHDYYKTIIEAARKNAASRFVSYESFGSDSAYANRLEEYGAEFKVAGIVTVVSDQPKVRWAIYGNYSNDEAGSWSDYVKASTEEEANFVARQQMARNEGDDPNDLDNFELTMQDIEIKECGEEPVTLDEMAVTMQKLVNACAFRVARTHPALKEAKERLKALGYKI